MKKLLVTFAALLVTAALFYWFPFDMPGGTEAEKGVPITRVWLAREEAELLPWLKKMAAVYENTAGRRVYIRACMDVECRAAEEGAKGVVPPDVLAAPRQAQAIALQGYALFLRDETAEKTTPSPTSALFFRLTPVPEKAPSPPPMPGLSSLSTVLVPEGWPRPMENAVFSPDPAGEFAKGTGEAAVLTAAQAEKMPFAVRAYALPDGFLPLTAKAFSAPGEQFLDFLLGETAQRGLSAVGLYSVQPGLSLYDAAAQPIRTLIESNRKSELRTEK